MSTNTSLASLEKEMVVEEDGLSLTTQKVIVLVSIIIVTFTTGLVPFKLVDKLRKNKDRDSQARWRVAISFSSCFAGGAFLGACLLDLLPEVEEIFEEVLPDQDYPVAQLTIGCGFLIILLLEQTVVKFQERWQKEEYEEVSQDAGASNLTPNGENPSECNRCSFSSMEHQPLLTDQSGNNNGSTEANFHHSHLHSGGKSQHSAFRSLMLLFALSFHRLFEGMAIGLQQSTSQMLSITIAIVVHEAIVSFSLGISLAQSNLSVKSYLISNLIQCLSSPLGIALGIPLSSLPYSVARDTMSGTLQGIAGGTFIYVTFFEILPPELDSPSQRLWKVLFIALGYAAMCCIVLI